MTSLQPGGVENYFLRFLRHTSGEFRPIIICKSGQGGALEEQFKNLNCKILKFKVGYFNVINWIRIYFLFRKYNVSSVCDFTGNFAGVYLLIANLARVKVRVVFYRQSSNHFKPSIFRNSYNWLVKKLVENNATAILANSKTGLDFFFPGRAATDSRFEVIYNGIDANLFLASMIDKASARSALNLPQNCYVIGHTGRFNSAKNHKTIFKVAKELTSANPDVIFVFCGRNTDDPAFMDALKEFQIEHRVVVLGYRKDIPVVLSSFDLFYFPSITEGQPNSLIEAMIAGVPIVASNIPSIVETVPDFLRSQLVDPFDVEGAVQKISNVVSSSTSQLNQQAREWALEHFSAAERFRQFAERL